MQENSNLDQPQDLRVRAVELAVEFAATRKNMEMKTDDLHQLYLKIYEFLNKEENGTVR